ncbi:MAG TPA: DUF6298 domain-containing protein [Chthonomonadaceae bacterium]|nr:DUF6298 domain-containing protein [Chthonomonadaceae bacterium]
MGKAKTVFQGPLRILKSNPRYFTDGSGRAVYLTGAHTWSDLQDMGETDPPKPFDYAAYLDFLQAHHLNLIRLWRWELPRWKEDDGIIHYCVPQPWKRVGPTLAQDGKPRFDLKQFDPAYFRRLRQRVVAARDRGIYVSIMLFEGWGMQFASQAWQEHPFHPDNHLPDVAGFPAADSQGTDIYSLKYPAVTALQEAYVRKVLDTVNDLDNVLYEISNENPPSSTDWQYHMIRFIHDYEASKRKQHPVGMTFQYAGGSNQTLFASPADWISPNPEGGYRDAPPPNEGRKVILLDTDHLWGEGGNVDWVWKSFLRGHNPLYMDRVAAITGNKQGDIADAEAVRQALGDTRRYAERMNLAAMTPQQALSSTGYCLADPGKAYLVYQPDKGAFAVSLAPGTYRVEWYDTQTRRTTAGTTVAGGGTIRFTPPSAGSAALYLTHAA